MKNNLLDNSINEKPKKDRQRVLIILLTIFMPPIGALLLLFSKKFTKISKIFGVAWLCLFFIFPFLPDNQDIAQDTTVNQTVESNDSESVLYTMTKSVSENASNESLDKYIPYLINSTVGEKNNTGHKSLLSYQVDSDNTVFLKLYASDNLTNNMTLRGIILDSKKIFKKFYSDRNDINDLVIDWYLTLVDKKGNEKLGKVALLSLKRENNNTINWDNVITDNIPDIVDSYWVHPVLR